MKLTPVDLWKEEWFLPHALWNRRKNVSIAATSIKRQERFIEDFLPIVLQAKVKKDLETIIEKYREEILIK